MNPPLHFAPMPEVPKVNGPALYFRSIEKTYGKPVTHWMEILKSAGDFKHMELVSLLKTKHRLGTQPCKRIGGALFGAHVRIGLRAALPQSIGLPTRLNVPLFTRHLTKDTS